ncbi:MAG: DUF6290 family protein [Methylobacter sp.]|nr:DUF6290 family protein [Methylobacter sp.]MDP2100753.1 DUF6290 family protein [Methylobacter sp.]MDP2429895.1 DUF6290 family protein [Methylobacter sp.]MDP3056082.1 DUF6290 family protein [Methylobacter sp.]MDP3362852.1 DUF6290 family protein [Methylobacter sp.]
MMTLELDDETATLLTELVELEHLSHAQLLKKMLQEHLENYQDELDAKEAEQVLQESGGISLSELKNKYGL